jgi:hypothetical protein
MRRVASRGLVVAFLVGLAALGYVVYQSAAARQQSGVATPAPTAAAACSPVPCANVQGYLVWITGLQAQGGSVALDVSFENSSSSTHADPADFTLVDSSGRSFSPIYDSADCPHWPRTEFSNGARRGPFHLCFKPGTSAAPLKLHWTPDMGLFCCRTDIVLTT